MSSTEEASTEVVVEHAAANPLAAGIIEAELAPETAATIEGAAIEAARKDIETAVTEGVEEVDVTQ